MGDGVREVEVSGAVVRAVSGWREVRHEPLARGVAGKAVGEGATEAGAGGVGVGAGRAAANRGAAGLRLALGRCLA